MTRIGQLIDHVIEFIKKINIYVFLASSLCLLLGTVTESVYLKAVAVSVILISLTFHLCVKIYKNNFMTLLGVLSLCAHFLVAICLIYLFDFGADSLEYDFNAAAMARSLNNGISIASIPVFKQHFTHFVAVIYYLLGPDRLTSTLIVSFFTVLSGIFIYLSCRMSKMKDEAGYFASVAIWFMPGFIIFTSDLLKDSTALCLTALSFYLFALLIYGKKSKLQNGALIITLVLVIAASAFIRFYIFVPIILGFGLSLLIYFFQGKGIGYKVLALAVFVLFAVLFVVLTHSHLDKYLGMSLDKLFEYVNKERQGQFAYSAAGIKGYDISSWDRALRHMPMLCIHYLFEPLPLSWLAQDTASYIKLLIPDMILWYAILPFVLIGGWLSFSKRQYIGIAALGFFIVFLGVDALLVGNVGAIYRYRLQLQEIGFILAGIGVVFAYKTKSYKKWIVIATVTCLAYISIYAYVGLRYTAGGIDISNARLTLSYQVEQPGRYTLRYSVDSPKTNEESKPMEVSVRKTDTDEIIDGVQYDATAKGYASLYLDVDEPGSLTIDFDGREASYVNDAKIIAPGGNVTVLAGRYPMLPQGLYDFCRGNSWLVSNTTDTIAKKVLFPQGLLDEPDQTVLGEKVRYKGVETRQTGDGLTVFTFTLECLDEMDKDYTFWMHLNVDDINTLTEKQKPSGYINCDHKLEVPTNTWEAGKEYKHEYSIQLKEGYYKLSFGFWVSPSDGIPAARLFAPNGNAGVTVGWVRVE